MQVIINISEADYEGLKGKDKFNDIYLNYYEKLIVNGIPLPKGHGRLIDYGYVVDAIDDWVNAEEYRYTNATDYLRKRVADTPTIIEADKVEIEKEEKEEDILDKIRAEIIDTLYVDSLIFGELIDFQNGKISADDVIEEFNRVTRIEVLQIIDKYKAEREDKE